MIQVSELRVGNWVNMLHGNVQIEKFVDRGVHATDGNGSIFKHLDPIQITPEILKKAGFDECADGNEYRIGLPLGNGTDLVIETLEQDSGPYDVLISDTTADEVPKHFSYVKAVRYLHQLQNLYFAIAGTELEIKL